MAAEPPAKRSRPGKLIVTHSGTFHADEALAVHLLKTLDEYRDAELVRTRDPKKIAEADIVVDVGAVYDPASHRYDHHQRGFYVTFNSETRTKLSSAGLVYKHFGPRIVAPRLGCSPDDPRVAILVNKLYDNFVEALDGIDNGVAQYGADGGGEPVQRYRSRTDLSSRIGKMNPSWNEESTDDILDSKFQQASALAGSEFFAELDNLIHAWLPGKEIVAKAYRERKNVDPSGKIILFETFAPWKDHAFDLEKDEGLSPDDLPLYVLYPDTGSSWRIQAIPKAQSSFESRRPLPEPWRGLRDEELSQKTGLPGCIFVHASGFIGGHQSKDGALAMAQKALAF